ncbi:MAG: hypothetical protein ACXWYP_00785 [Pseudonocardia sp.]
MAAIRTTRSSARPAAVLAVLTLLAAVAALLALSGTAQAQDLNCRDDFRYQEDAQVVPDANPADPNNLDGKACETLPSRGTAAATTTTEPVPITPTVVAYSLNAVNALDSGTGTSGTASTTTSATSTDTTTATTTATTTSSGTSGDDRDCADFASQADAEAALTSEPSDPDNLDADDDGIACEQHFGEEGQQVQVHPTGGVDTGGGPADA